MATDFSKPVVTDAYATLLPGVVTALQDLARGLDPVLTGTSTNIPTGTKRFNEATFLWERYNGTSWVAMAASYAISISGSSASCTGNAATANTAHALTAANNYTVNNFTANGRVYLANGSAAAPALTFLSEGAYDTGFFWNTDGNINWSNNGVQGGFFSPGGHVTATQYNGGGAGLTGTAPSFTAGYVTNGVYLTGDQTLSGIKTISGSWRAPTGSMFQLNDPNHGMLMSSGAVDGPEFRGYSGFIWKVGATGATEVMRLDASGTLTAVAFTGSGANLTGVLSLGVSQTWQAPARSFGTQYTNSTGRTIAVTATGYCAPAGSIELQGYVAGTLIKRTYTVPPSGFGNYATIELIVPSGATYQINHTGNSAGNTPNIWYELRN